MRRPEDTEGSIPEQMLRPRSWSWWSCDHMDPHITGGRATIKNVSVALRLQLTSRAASPKYWKGPVQTAESINLNYWDDVNENLTERMWNWRAAIREERRGPLINNQSITVTLITNYSDIDSSLWRKKNLNPSDSISWDVNILWFLFSLTINWRSNNSPHFTDQTDWSTMTIIIYR